MTTKQSNPVKVVARTRSGETIKGWVSHKSLKDLEQNRPIFLKFSSPGNTLGTYVTQEQLSGFFLVKTFEGKKPNPVSKTFFILRQTLTPHLTMISGALVVALASVAGLMALA